MALNVVISGCNQCKLSQGDDYGFEHFYSCAAHVLQNKKLSHMYTNIFWDFFIFVIIIIIIIPILFSKILSKSASKKNVTFA